MKLDSTIHFDRENNAVFCRFQISGELDAEKRAEYRDTLVEAFSTILGLNLPDESDFEPIKTPGDIFEEIPCEDSFDIPFEDFAEVDFAEEEFGAEEANEAVEPKVEEVPEPMFAFGAAKDLTPSQAIKDPKFGEEYLQKMLPILERNVKRFPDNQVLIDAIKRVLSTAS